MAALSYCRAEGNLATLSPGRTVPKKAHYGRFGRLMCALGNAMGRRFQERLTRNIELGWYSPSRSAWPSAAETFHGE
jgi:hypothetical protein